MARLALVREQDLQLDREDACRAARACTDTGPHAMVRLLARVIGIGMENDSDMLVRGILSRNLRDRRALARSPGSRDRAIRAV